MILWAAWGLQEHISAPLKHIAYFNSIVLLMEYQCPDQPLADKYTKRGVFPVMLQYWAVSQWKCVCMFWINSKHHLPHSRSPALHPMIEGSIDSFIWHVIFLSRSLFIRCFVTQSIMYYYNHQLLTKHTDAVLLIIPAQVSGYKTYILGRAFSSGFTYINTAKGQLII